LSDRRKEPARLPERFFLGDAREVAQALLGKLLVHADGRAARLVEVEAYLGLDDPGSHAYRGPTPRAAIMFGPPGRLYVYFSYGMHWCANIVCGPPGLAAAVLLRAAEPVAGLEAMRAARGRGGRAVALRDLCRGPARLTEAFGVTGADNGSDLCGAGSKLWLVDDGNGPGGRVIATRRVGLSASRGRELPWRYVVEGSPWASPGPRTGHPVRRPARGRRALPGAG
jgi:DNA-3-methyladenine glycosylase